ncbi:MAG TPA: hypothetical protein VGK84_08445, partial [Candidatus Tumulicola sp.]
PGTLYVDHYGILYQYALPLQAGSRPIQSFVESDTAAVPPQIAVDPYGTIAIATDQDIYTFGRPIRSLDPSHAKLKLKLTPAITEIGPAGADLVDIEYDPNNNLWLFNNLGGEISELTAPIRSNSVAGLTIAFGAPGTKAAGFTGLIQGRFDVNAALYVYANQAATDRSGLFKISFPYAKPPSPEGVNLGQADFVDASQYAATNPNPNPVLLGQYTGLLRSPPPGSPPPPPINAMAQFVQPFPVTGPFPDATVNTIVGALIADPQRSVFYTLDNSSGALSVWALPLKASAAPQFMLPCPGTTNCADKPEHLFLAP